MWFKKYKFTLKSKGLNKSIPPDYFTKPCTKEEFEFFRKNNDNSKSHKDYEIPNYLRLPTEYIELLKHSNSGVIINGDREFSFFDIETIRQFYFDYGFIIYAPSLLPIAFNGGGTFYVYKFINIDKKPEIYGVHASCIGFEEDTCFLGNSLDKVLSKRHYIDDDIYEHQVKNGAIKTPITSKEKQEKDNLLKELKTLKENKNLEKVDLKNYLKAKRELQKKLNDLQKTTYNNV